MRKLQSFFVLKFKSSRLRDTNYKIKKITLDEARQNQEVIRLGNSELIRCVQRIRGIHFDQSELDSLLNKKKRRKYTTGLNEQIDNLLYIPDIIDVEFDDARHYKAIINRGGIQINGKNYVRLLSSSGMARRSTVMFCNDEIIDDVREFLNCGRDPDFEIAPAKFNAYVSLASSATLRVSEPKFVVIPDCVVKRDIEVDFLHESDDTTKDPLVYPEIKTFDVNLFDGQGIISPSLSEKWSKELDCDYIPSTFIIRAPFLKGMVATFDFHLFAEEYGITTIKDIYGEEHYIEDIDLIVSESQFKLWAAYENTEDYIQKCREHDFSWGITKVSPSIDKDYCFSTYQYVQNLNIQIDAQIEFLCKKTVDWFTNVTGEDWVYTILFLLGNIDKGRLNAQWFDSLDNPLLQCLLLEPKLINDKQVQSKVQRLINKKIRESYLGNLLLDGNYQIMLSDPLAQVEWGLGLQVKGLLKEGEHYSWYWNNKNINKVSAIRSPMTFVTENNILNLQNNKDMQKWYKYIDSGIIFNCFGTDMMRMSGGDNDGDSCMTTPQKEFVDCAYENFLPPAYERKNASKKKIDESELWEYDVKTFKSRIGLITNIGTQLFAMLPLFEKDSEEYKEILNRLKICNCFQSMEIDRAKGIKTMNIPKYWTKWEKILDSDSEETKKLKELHQKTICEKRPYFFRYLYPDYDKKYKQKLEIYDNYCESAFDGNFEYIKNKDNKSEEELRTINEYYKYNDLLMSNCVMNNVCRYMENKVKELKENNKFKSFDFKSLFVDTDFYQQKNKKLIENIYAKYKQYKISINYHSNSSGFKEMMGWLRKQIDGFIETSDEIVFWGSEFGTSFLLDVFPVDVINVLKEYTENEIMIPVKSDDGYIEYMGSKYEIDKILL